MLWLHNWKNNKTTATGFTTGKNKSQDFGPLWIACLRWFMDFSHVGRERKRYFLYQNIEQMVYKGPILGEGFVAHVIYSGSNSAL